MKEPHALMGSEEQFRELAKAITARRVLIESLRHCGGVHVDNYLSEVDEALIYLQQQLKSKGLD